MQKIVIGTTAFSAVTLLQGCSDSDDSCKGKTYLEASTDQDCINCVNDEVGRDFDINNPANLDDLEKALKECGFDGEIPSVDDLGPCAGVANPSNNTECQSCIETQCSAAGASGCSPTNADAEYITALAACQLPQ